MYCKHNTNNKKHLNIRKFSYTYLYTFNQTHMLYSLDTIQESPSYYLVTLQFPLSLQYVNLLYYLFYIHM